MPDEIRSRAALLTAFADNSTGNITAQNARDLIESATPPACAIGYDGANVPQALLAATPALVAATMTPILPGTPLFLTPATNRITNVSTNAVPLQVQIHARIAGIDIPTSSRLTIQIYKNGAPLTGGRNFVRGVGAGAATCVQVTALDVMNPGDFYEPWITTTGAVTYQISVAYLSVLPSVA